MGTSHFFPSTDEQGRTPRGQHAAKLYAEARKVCAGCEVKAECLEVGMAQDPIYGVWGGLTPNEVLERRYATERPVRLATTA